MKLNFIFLILSALFLASCASTERTPASAEEKREATHQRFEGYFDRPVQ